MTQTNQKNQISRNWVFTLNNPKEPLDFDKLNALSLIYQLELGQEQTPHYQGYIRFEKNRRFSAVKKLLPTAHWEIRRGSHSQAIAYCSKEDTRIEGPWRFGDFTNDQGKRSDLDEVKDLIDNGATLKDVYQEHFAASARYSRFFSEYRLAVQPKRSWQTQCIVIYGPPRTGKSTWVTTQFPDAYVKDQSKWWTGYAGEETVMIDEFYGWIPINELKRILDFTKLTLDAKYGHVNFIARYLFIISNKHPDQWYPNHPPGDVHYDALKTRFTAIKYKPSLEEDFVDEWVNPEPRLAPGETLVSE